MILAYLLIVGLSLLSLVHRREIDSLSKRLKAMEDQDADTEAE